MGIYILMRTDSLPSSGVNPKRGNSSSPNTKLRFNPERFFKIELNAQLESPKVTGKGDFSSAVGKIMPKKEANKLPKLDVKLASKIFDALKILEKNPIKNRGNAVG